MKTVILTKARPWAFFDGTCRGRDSIVDVGFRSTWWILTFSVLKPTVADEPTTLQVKGESLLTINWITGLVHVINNSLFLLAKQLKKDFKEHFQLINFQHLYREQNLEADQLSKAGLDLDENCQFLEKDENNVLLHNRIDVLNNF